jgi:hypothetical protein
MNLDDPDELEQFVLSSELLARILERQRDTAHSLLAEAALEWIAEGCPRYNDHETSCTAALVGHVIRTIDERKARAFQPLVTLETGAWTEAHFSGAADPDSVPRPDVVMWFGLRHEARMNIECKRLLSGSATANDYVKKGMCRFLDGRYPTDEGIGTMIAFLLDRDGDQAVEEINTAIEAIIKRVELLGKVEGLGGLDSVYESDHAVPTGDLSLVHLLLDLRKRGPALQG